MITQGYIEHRKKKKIEGRVMERNYPRELHARRHSPVKSSAAHQRNAKDFPMRRELKTRCGGWIKSLGPQVLLLVY